MGSRDRDSHALEPTAASALRRYERRFSLIWVVTLLTECALRVVGAVTLEPSTMAWLSDALLVGAIVVAMFISGGAASARLEEMVVAEAAA